MYSVLRSGTVRKSMWTVDEKQDISLLWPYNVVVLQFFSSMWKSVIFWWTLTYQLLRH